MEAAAASSDSPANGRKPPPSAVRWMKPDVRPKLAELMGAKAEPADVAAFQKGCYDAERLAIERGEHGPQALWREISKRVLHPFKHPLALHQWVAGFVFDAAVWDVATLGPAPLWTPTADACADTNLARFMRDFSRHLKAEGLACPEWERGCTGDPAADWPLLQRVSYDHPTLFWPLVLEKLGIHFETPPTRVLDAPANAWLPGARLNIAESCFAKRDPEMDAVVYADPGGAVRRLSRGELRAKCVEVMNALRAAGFAPGDRVAIDMAMHLESVCIYLGLVLAGCVAVSIAESFSAGEIASRVRISEAKAIFASEHVHARIVEGGVKRCIVVPPGAHDGGALATTTNLADGGDGHQAWADFMRAGKLWAKQHGNCATHVCASDDISNILFSSGTTGDPKAIPWSHVTPIRCGSDAFAHHDIRERDVVCWPTNLGWMMGPWLLYAALLNGAAVALFHGSPTDRLFPKFVEQARVTMLGLVRRRPAPPAPARLVRRRRPRPAAAASPQVPTMVNAWRLSKTVEGSDWGRIRCFSSSGEASSPEAYHWLMATGGYASRRVSDTARAAGRPGSHLLSPAPPPSLYRYKPVIEYCGGTEIGGGFLTGTMLQPCAPSTFTTPSIGARICLLHDDGSRSEGHTAPPGKGELALHPPMLGTSTRLLNRDHDECYYAGMPSAPGPVGVNGGAPITLRRHGDAMERLPSGAYRAHGRIDDTMNLNGVKVSSAELEAACNRAHDAVLETAAVGVPPPGGGPEKLHVFVVLKKGQEAPPLNKLKILFNKAMAQALGPGYYTEGVHAVDSLPRTASNKVMRRVLRDNLEKA